MCPAQPVTFWDVVPQHQGCESLVLFTFSTHSLHRLPGAGQLSFQPACCLALNYGSLQATPGANPGL